MFNQRPLRYNPKTPENFLMFLGSTKREYRPNMGQHGLILQQLRNNKHDMKQKTSRYFKRTQLLHNGVSHSTVNQSDVKIDCLVSV